MRKWIVLKCWIDDQDYSVAACAGGLGFSVLASGEEKEEKTGDKKGRKQEKRKVPRVENYKTRKVCSRRSFLSTRIKCSITFNGSFIFRYWCKKNSTMLLSFTSKCSFERY